MPFLKIDGTSTTVTQVSTLQNLDYNLQAIGGQNKSAYGLSLQVGYTDVTPGAKVVPSASITFATCNFNLTAHGLNTGLVGQFTTSGSLPTGISAATNYYIIVVDANNFKVASSLANANAGTPITLSDAGTGNQTFTPTAINYTLALKASNDGTNFVSVTGTSIAVTATGSTIWDVSTPFYKVLRLVATPTAGAITLVLTYNAVNFA